MICGPFSSSLSVSVLLADLLAATSTVLRVIGLLLNEALPSMTGCLLCSCMVCSFETEEQLLMEGGS